MPVAMPQWVLSKVIHKTVNTESTDKYIFQFDNHTPRNWVKKIVTPGNSYTTRTIEYFKEAEPKEQTSN